MKVCAFDAGTGKRPRRASCALFVVKRSIREGSFTGERKEQIAKSLAYVLSAVDTVRIKSLQTVLSAGQDFVSQQQIGESDFLLQNLWNTSKGGYSSPGNPAWLGASSYERIFWIIMAGNVLALVVQNAIRCFLRLITLITTVGKTEPDSQPRSLFIHGFGVKAIQKITTGCFAITVTLGGTITAESVPI